MTAALPAATNRDQLALDYQRVRQTTLDICAPLLSDDYQTQSIVETSPPKWHLGHVTWFFETFLLQAYTPNYQAVHADYNYVFNSYYQTVGSMQPRAKRGVLSRPTLEAVFAYRAAVDERLLQLIHSATEADWDAMAFRITLGLHHEQQHQELLYMDIKHNFWSNPLRPIYAPHTFTRTTATELGWENRAEGLVEIGFNGQTFAYDNERPTHRVWLDAHALADRLTTNGEYLAFIEDGGYVRPDLWLADGWFHRQQHAWQAPLYWAKRDGQWYEFTLHGFEPLDLAAPVAHTSYYEADAFARWAGKRLPLEAELEYKLNALPSTAGHFTDSAIFHPQAGTGQWYGSLWEWTASPYTAYPRFKPLEGSMGEYNGKFMCNQWVLRGGACITPADHIRPTYRNFFYPHDRWQFSGIRLAEDL